MGNNILSECKYGVSSHNDMVLKPNIQQIKETDSRTKQKQIFSCQFYPERTGNVQRIYKQLVKQKPVSYSIQNESLLQFYQVGSLKQLLQKQSNLRKTSSRLNQRVYQYSDNFTNENHIDRKYENPSGKRNQVSGLNSSQDETWSNKTQKEKTQFQLKTILFTLKLQSTQHQYLQTQHDKQTYRNRSLSKSFEQTDQIEDFKQKQEQEEFSSIYSLQDFNIFDKRYIFVGLLNENNKPHGPGQLYCYNQSVCIDQIVYSWKQRKEKQKTIQNSLKQNLAIFIEAEFVDGNIFSQDCIIIFEKGNFYRGSFKGDIFQGKGKLSTSNGLFLIGNFVGGFLQGRGKAVYPDNGTYEGQFQCGLREGRGKMIWKSQLKPNNVSSQLEIFYEGFFKNDKMNGLGYLRTPNYEYWGPFVDNMKEGKGTIKFKDGKKFEGWFQKDQINGYGQLHYPDGHVQKGNFPLQKQ